MDFGLSRAKAARSHLEDDVSWNVFHFRTRDRLNSAPRGRRTALTRFPFFGYKRGLTRNLNPKSYPKEDNVLKSNFVSKSLLAGLFAVLVLAATNSISPAQTCPPNITTNWVGTPAGSGEFFDPANWSASCSPNGGTNAFVNNGGVISTFDPNASSHHARLRVLVLGQNQGDSGSVKVNQSAFITFEIDAECRVGEEVPNIPSPYLAGDMYIGRKGKGTLDISNGNLVVFSSAFIAAVDNSSRPASSGVVTVSGAGTIWRAFGPCYGNLLCVGCDRIPNDGGTSDSGGTGSVTIKDSARIEIYNDNPASPGLKVGRSGTLAGNGIVKLATQLDPCPSCQTAKVLGTLAPNGQLKLQGKLELDNISASVVCHVTPQGADSINVTQETGLGQVKLGGRLTVMMAGTFTPGSTFTLVHADGGLLNSTFASESIILSPSLGPCMTPTITYDANNVYLYLQPCL
jgi:hypothetical protein